MVGFFGASAASDHCRLLTRNGSVHHELIRRHHGRQIRCCSSTARGRTRDYYYQVLGIAIQSTPQQIKEAYRKLQKQHHPDIAGYKVHPFPSSSCLPFALLFFRSSLLLPFIVRVCVPRKTAAAGFIWAASNIKSVRFSEAKKNRRFWDLNVQGHDYTLLLNEAYKVLMRDVSSSRHADGRGRSRVGSGAGYTGDGYSSWEGPVRSQALFVDENKCIGCRECVHHAARTFAMDDVLGSAHVEVQFGDLEQQIQVVFVS